MAAYFVQGNRSIQNEAEKEALTQLGYVKTRSLKRSRFVYVLNVTKVESYLARLAPDARKIVNGIDGCDDLISKFSLWANLVNAYGRRVARTLTPTTYIIKEFRHKKQGCADQRLFLLKGDRQQQTALRFVTCAQFFRLKKRHLNRYVVVQRFLQNPFVIHKRKVNIRVYILIVLRRGQPAAAYMYDDGFMYYTPAAYRRNSTNVKETITTGYIDRRVYETNPLTHGDLRAYLGPQRATLLFDNINRVLTVVLRALLPKLKNKFGTSFHIFGADVQPSERLRVKLLEVNKGPDLTSKDERDGRLKRRMIQDAYEIACRPGQRKTARRNGFVRLI